MSYQEELRSSVLRRVLDRVGNPLEWSFVDKALLFIGFALLMNVPFTLALHFSFRVPGLTPEFFDRSLHHLGIQCQWGFVLLFAVLFGIGWRIRRKDPDNRWLVYGLAVVAAVHDAWFMAAIGHSTNPATFLTLFVLGLVGLMFFDLCFALIAIGVWVLAMGGTVAAEQAGVLPYAAALVHSPHTGGRIDPWWMWVGFAVCGAITACMLLAFGYVLSRWRKREAQVVELSDFLKNMFGRYLSTEVMKTLIENPSAVELGGERRRVTIMMTDLRGFTAQSERLEPEQVVRMLNTYFEVMVDVVMKYNGTINEIVGDALLVIFGAPREMPHRARHAVACAVEMQNAVGKVNAQNRAMGLPELEMGIGLNDDEVIVGNIGSSKRSKYAVVGSGVNMTSRIESYTVGGQILVSETVRKEAGDVLRIDGQMDVVPKGAEAPIRIYEVGGIAGGYNLMLEEEDPELATLSRTLPLEYRLLEGKHEGRVVSDGFIHRLSKKGAEISTAEAIGPMSNLKLRLKEVDEALASKDFYGKVIESSQDQGVKLLVRFTSLPPEVGAFFQAHLQYALASGRNRSR